MTTHPTIRFEADNVAADDGGLRVQALVTIKGLTRRIELRGHEHADPHALRLHVRGELDRHDFDIKPRPPLDSVVGREVQLEALLRFHPGSLRSTILGSKREPGKSIKIARLLARRRGRPRWRYAVGANERQRPSG